MKKKKIKSLVSKTGAYLEFEFSEKTRGAIKAIRITNNEQKAIDEFVFLCLKYYINPQDAIDLLEKITRKCPKLG